MSDDVRTEPPVVVLAGGTGTGKSTLARALARRGAFVLDADRIGHETLLVPEVRDRVIEVFGTDILDTEGEIDRRRLGPLVFGDPEGRVRLDRLVHPPLVAEIGRRIDHLRASRAVPLIVVDAALWWQFEESPQVRRPEVDLVVMTTADPRIRLRRIVARDGVEDAAARARIAAQASIEASLPRADAVLETDAPAEEVLARLVALLDERLGLGLARSWPGP